MAEPMEERCERCGVYGPGRSKWMFHGTRLRSRVGLDLYCFRCLRVMRVYAVIGFTLLAAVVGGLIAVTLWLTHSVG